MITTFGEIMLRLSPPGAYRIAQADSFDAVYGGAEENVAIALASFGEHTSYVTKLPQNAVGDACLNSIRQWGVDTSHILRGGDRLGLYYLEKGASLRASAVTYDRKGSAFAMSGIDDYDWNVILPQDDSASHGNAFFYTGITPAVGENLPGILRDALEVCRSRKIRTYCDLNYRAALWTTEKAGSVLRELLPYTDVCVANEEHAEQLFGITTAFTEQNDRLRDIAEKLCAEFALSRVVMTMRRSLSADDNEVSAATLNAKTGEFTVSRTYPVHIIDRVGGGDALSSGIIYGELHGFDEAHLIEFASAANAFKHSIHGDALIASAAEIDAVAQAKTGEIRMKR